jgi:membrane protein YqaA with SNARE-associated domain
MKGLTQVLFALFAKSGGLGLLLLGILDSSFIFAPLGNDLLVVAMTAHHHTVGHLLYYSAMSTIGSVLGCLLVDVVIRPAGERGLEKHLPRRRLEYVRKRVEKSAPVALAIASIAPPPFPFTPFIMAAAALQYSRTHMLAIVGIARMARFTALGVLAYFFGERILAWADGSVVQGLLLGLTAVCLVGSVVSVYGWIKRSRGARGAPEQPREHAPAH